MRKGGPLRAGPPVRAEPEMLMLGKLNAHWRWMALAASGAVLFQLPSCDVINQYLQTSFLGVIAGGLLYLIKNV